tara:strand:- start:569 stop:724 length:156 start_codon:yes stop_codon:yes gene_type:complete
MPILVLRKLAPSSFFPSFSFLPSSFSLGRFLLALDKFLLGTLPDQTGFILL